ncbi:MAG TPA: DinB family protein [Candidatus Acidoferrum sp.]|nr:DinB family protein [Candidatus Acidoferrum sp.]
MKITQQIADAYRAATVKDAWYGPSLAELISRTTPELATLEPRPKANTISAILQHMLLWNERIRLTSAAQPMPKWEPEKEWAEAAIAWKELISRWQVSRDNLEEQIRKFPDEELGRQVPGRTYNFEYLYRGAGEHVIYHSGQIAMILGMLSRHAG